MVKHCFMYLRKAPTHFLIKDLTYIGPSPCPRSYISFPNINPTLTIPPKSHPPSIMNLKLSALIFFTSTLISLSTSFPQEPKDDSLEKARAKLHDLAQRPAPSLEVIPVNSSDVNPHKKRNVSILPSTSLYVCEEPLLKGRCQRLACKRGFCCKFNLLFVLTRTNNTFPSHGIITLFFFVCVCNIEQ